MATFKEILAIKQVEPERFQGTRLPQHLGHFLPIAFGGYTMGVAVKAAHYDVPENRRLFAASGNFLSPTMTDRPVFITTKTYRSTKTFTTKLVEVLQNQDNGQERVCMVALVDFHVIEADSFFVFSAPPSKEYSSLEESWTVPERKKMMLEEKIATQAQVDLHGQVFQLVENVIDERWTKQSVHGQNLQGFTKGVKTTQDHLPLDERSSAEWFKLREKLETPSENAASLAFVMDGLVADHPLILQGIPLTAASACSTLEFSLRFLTPEINMNEFHLREWKTYAADAARTFSESRIWDRKGKMVASMIQTSILRPKRPKL